MGPADGAAVGVAVGAVGTADGAYVNGRSSSSLGGLLTQSSTLPAIGPQVQLSSVAGDCTSHAHSVSLKQVTHSRGHRHTQNQCVQSIGGG